MPNYLEFRESISKEMLAVKDRVRTLIGAGHHKGEDGSYKEYVLMNILRSYLPDTVRVGTGFVISGERVSTQIDIIIYSALVTPFFRSGDFVIVEKGGVKGIIEVKTRLNRSDIRNVVRKAHDNGELIAEPIFNGIFAFESDLRVRDMQLPPASISALKFHKGRVNNIAFGKDVFMKYWRANELRQNKLEHISFYDLSDLSFGYFISNLAEDVSGTRLTSERQRYYYPVDGGKEKRRIHQLEINFDGEERAMSILIRDKYVVWEREAAKRFDTLKANEEELNRIFIDIYGLQDELDATVEDKDVTVRRADLGREIRSLISYAVGCMFGRYSLDVEGLAYAGGKWDAGKYRTFPADKDNILPICDDEYFDDDIAGRFVEFVKTVYGTDTLEENLKFIADALGDKGTPREVIRNYFLNDFYKDHCKIYQKRPIYWLFDSGKKNGFKALIYMHRYSRDLLAKLRTNYVHEQQERYRTQLSHIVAALNTATGAERARLLKQQDKLSEQAREIGAFEEKVHHLADQNITIDLDNGVKRNYEIFADVLAKI